MELTSGDGFVRIQLYDNFAVQYIDICNVTDFGVLMCSDLYELLACMRNKKKTNILF